MLWVKQIGHYHNISATKLNIVFGVGKTSGTLPPMTLLTLLDQEKHVHFWYFITMQDVTRCSFSLEGERKQFGIPRIHSLKPLELF
jgi:hypothetical protein